MLSKILKKGFRVKLPISSLWMAYKSRSKVRSMRKVEKRIARLRTRRNRYFAEALAKSLDHGKDS